LKYITGWISQKDNLRVKDFYSFIFYFILFYFILFYFILFYFILFYFILFYFILFYFILFYFILFYFSAASLPATPLWRFHLHQRPVVLVYQFRESLLKSMISIVPMKIAQSSISLTP